MTVHLKLVITLCASIALSSCALLDPSRDQRGQYAPPTIAEDAVILMHKGVCMSGEKDLQYEGRIFMRRAMYTKDGSVRVIEVRTAGVVRRPGTDITYSSDYDSWRESSRPGSTKEVAAEIAARGEIPVEVILSCLRKI